jgi:hypothetical protein
MRVHRHGANAKLRHSVVDVVVLGNQSSVVMSIWHRKN